MTTTAPQSLSLVAPYIRGCRLGRITLITTLACAGLLTACDSPKIEEQRLPKGTETVPAPSPVDPDADPTPPGSPEAGAQWSLPAGWTRVTGERPMRLATFEAPDESGPVEIALTRFPGTVGGDLANINRWRTQMGLAPIDEPELDDTLNRFTAPGAQGYEVRIAGESTHMLAAGIYETAEDRTWFLRATVAPDVADRLEDDFFAFARSIVPNDEQEAE